MNELREKYGDQIQMEDMPKNSITRPAVVWKPMDFKKQIVPWDWKKALQLWQKRHPDNGEELPSVFDDIDCVTRDSRDLAGRTRLILKLEKVEDKIFYTTDDE
jgi:hypothetical protein